jgi:uncharacterized protein YoxC
MDKLQEIKRVIDSYEGSIKVVITRPQELIDDFNWLIKTIEQQQKEYNTLYSSIAEDDTVVEQLQEEIAEKELFIKSLENFNRQANERIRDLEITNEMNLGSAKHWFKEAESMKAKYMDLDD